jgi:lipopolysaccharide transport system ATP-binding protein
MDKPIIEVKNIGKQYKITHQRGSYVALRDVMASIVKKPFSFIADKAKSATGFKRKEEFWALKGVNFDVNKGEVIGVIGHNGAGKSTLLKILSQITPPTEGEIILRGRVGSLLEVGTGFHPELTGRENIFLNGAILGMRKFEIAKKFDDIVAFSGVEKFLDTPVKYYSSGMYVRLAFSVAAHMEPDILLVDEVLAVGDAEFQKKCLGKMDEITKKEGRTILFVSHNLGAISQLCSKSILMEHGHVALFDQTDQVIHRYLKTDAGKASIISSDEKAKILSCSLINAHLAPVSNIKTDEKIGVKIDFELNDDTKTIVPNYALLSADGSVVWHTIAPQTFDKGVHSVINWIPARLLNNKNYRVKAALVSFNPTRDHSVAEFSFQAHEPARDANLHGYSGEIHGVVRPTLDWQIIK